MKNISTKSLQLTILTIVSSILIIVILTSLITFVYPISKNDSFLFNYIFFIGIISCSIWTCIILFQVYKLLINTNKNIDASSQLISSLIMRLRSVISFFCICIIAGLILLFSVIETDIENTIIVFCINIINISFVICALAFLVNKLTKYQSYLLSK